MMKKLKILFDGVKTSKWFMIGVMLEIVLCILLMSIATTQHINAMGMLNFYDSAMAENSVINFNKHSTYGDAIENYDMSDMALVGEAYMATIDLNPILIATPTLVKKFKQLGLNFKINKSDDYMEAVAKEMDKKTYIKGEIYDIKISEFDGNGERITLRVKIVGYVKESFGYYGTNIELTNDFKLLLCGLPTPKARINIGVAFNGRGIEHYGRDGNYVRTAKEFYDINNPNSDDIFKELSVVAVLLTILSVFSCYMLSVDKQKRMYAIYYACGEKYSTLVGIEICKMLAIFVLGCVSAFLIAVCIKDLRVFSALGMIDMSEFFKASGIVFAVYALSIIVGLISIARVKPLKILSTTTME